jgi:fructose-1,6-bisphosphatase/inositol monophosphatase family enzyme
VEKSTNRSNVPDTLQIGEAAAQTAGAYRRQRLGEARVTSQKAAHDDLLDVDVGAERIILFQLRQHTPDLAILSEETASQAAYRQYRIVDPLDGSANFQHRVLSSPSLSPWSSTGLP